MPTMSECTEYFGNYALEAAAKKLSKWSGYAEMMGLKTAMGKRAFGGDCREAAARMLEEHGYFVEIVSQKGSHNLLVDGKVKVQARASGLFNNKKKMQNIWTFRTDKKCDAYMFICMGNDGAVENVFIVPCADVQYVSYVTITRSGGMYDKYAQRWDVIEAVKDIDDQQ
jgi:hypothetical protein